MDNKYLDFLNKIDAEDELINKDIIDLEKKKIKEDLFLAYDGDDQVISFKKLEDEIRNAPIISKMSSGINGLDDIFMGGFMPQTVTTISAQPKSGKTTFCMYLTTKMEKYNPLWIALEESAKSLVRKMIKNNMTIPLAYSPMKNPIVSLEWIEFKIMESRLKNLTSVVFIDQLDFIVPQENSDGAYAQKIALTMRTLHEIAVRCDVAIFLICHVEKMEPDVKPTVKNLRGSSSIWGESDNIIVLWKEAWREEGELQFSNNILVSVQANREDGKYGNIKMVYDNGTFKEQDWGNTKTNIQKNLLEF